MTTRNTSRIIGGAAQLMTCALCCGQPVQSNWLGTTDGGWTQASRWSTNPFYPNLDNPPGTQYNATFNTGNSFYHVQLANAIAVNKVVVNDPNVTIDHFAQTLTLGVGLDLNAGHYGLIGGTIDGGVINVSPQATLVINSPSSGGGSSHLRGVTLNGSLGPATVYIRDGLTLNGTISNSYLLFENSCTLMGGTLDNLGSASRGEVAVADGCTLTLGPGTVISHGDSPGTRIGTGIGAPPSVTTVVNQGRITTAGTGGMEIWASNFVNQGVLEATYNSGLDIGCAGGYGGYGASTFNTQWSNAGLIRLISDGSSITVLNLGGHFTTAGLGAIERVGGTINLLGVLDNTGSTLNLAPSTWSFNVRGGTIIGGIVNSSPFGGMGLIGNETSTLDGVTVNGDVAMGGGKTLIVKNGLTLNGNLFLDNSSFNTIQFQGTQTLTNGSMYSDQGNTRAYVNLTPGTVLTISPSTVIYGRNLSLQATAPSRFYNQGRISSNGAATSAIQIGNGVAVFTNDGVVEAAGGDVNLISGLSITNFQGSALVGGTWRVNPSSKIIVTEFAPTITINAADVTLSGQNSEFAVLNSLTQNQGALRLLQGRDLSVPASFDNTGLIELGAGCDLAPAAAFNQSGTGTTRIWLDGAAPALTSGAVHAGSGATLSGTLDIRLAGYTPVAGDQFVIIAAPTILGVFDNVQTPYCGPSLAIEVQYLATAVRLNVVANCYANCDLSTTPPILNANDFQCFLNFFASGDSRANCDHSTSPPTLNANDFQCFLNAFAAGCP